MTVKVSGSEIKCEKIVKLSRVDIDYQLNFDNHISDLCRKTGQQLNVLKRLSPYLSKLNKLTILHTFILSNFNYCPLAWHFCSEKIPKKLEKIQERALRFVYDDFNSGYEELLIKANIPSLHIRRLRTMAIETFKILNKMSPPVLSDLLNFEIVILIILDITIFYRYLRCVLPNTVRTVLNMQQQSCGTVSQMILGK